MRQPTGASAFGATFFFLAMAFSGCINSIDQDGTPEVATPEVATPEVATPEVATPEVATPDAVEPDVATPDVATPETTEPDATEPGAAEPDATEPDATEPDATEPDATEPDTTEPDVPDGGNIVFGLIDDASDPGAVTGYVDSVSAQGNEHFISGWACQNNVASSINVHLYAGGPAGTGELIGSGLANRGSETAVGTACGTFGVAHRFRIPLTALTVATKFGQPIFVHGIAIESAFSSNALLTRSGDFDVPSTIRLSRVLPLVGTTDFVIPRGLTVEVDTPQTNLGLIRVEGTLKCLENVSSKISTQGIVVMGEGARLSCGTATAPFAATFEIELTGNRDLAEIAPAGSSMHHFSGGKGLVVANGATLELHGETRKAAATLVDGNVSPGALSLTLLDARSWDVGDEIAIASSDYDPHHAERRIISQVLNGGRDIRFTDPLQYQHWGQTQRYFNDKGQSLVLDERAEVVNLKRSIRISSANDTHANDQQFGAHVMIMGTGVGYVDAVEFFRVGQMGKLGRYPFHWHKRGDVSGQYIKNSSIHDTYNRCVTIHSTDNALVDGNTCVNFFGHGYFLEIGNERRNVLTNNLAMTAKRVPLGRELLISDVQSNAIQRFAAPASFWISNPDNYVVGNRSVGSEGSGFWMAFENAMRCVDNDCTSTTVGANVFPIRENTWAFSDNVAHSSVVGITHDGAPTGASRNNPRNSNDRELLSAHYAPTVVPTFDSLVAYKNTAAGIYYRGQTAIYNINVLADNAVSFFVAYNQRLQNSLVIATSANHAPSEIDYLYAPGRGYWPEIAGVKMYDGPFELINVHFENFATSEVTSQGRNVSPVPISLMGGAARFTNYSSQLSFTPEPTRRVTLEYNPATGWIDSYSASLLDVDGTLTGTPGILVVPEDAFNNFGNCVPRPEWGAFLCGYRMATLRLFVPSNPNFIPFSVSRSDGASIAFPYGQTVNPTYHTKVPVIRNLGLNYTLTELELAGQALTLTYFAAAPNEASPIFSLMNLGQGCSLDGSNAMNSLAALNSAVPPAYFRNGTDLHIKLVTSATPSNGPEHGRNFVARCN